jgi:hypothetical protein
MSDPALGLLMLALIVVVIMMGFATAFTLMGLGIIFGFIAFYDPNEAWIHNKVFDLMVQRTYGAMTNDVLISIPLFVLMGYVMERGALVDKMFYSIQLAFRRVPASLAVATLIVCTFWGIASGLVGAVVVLMGVIAFNPMLRAGYDVKLASGVITAGGTLGILIPPSVMIIVYAAVAGQSVVKLYAAAMLPGFFLSFLYLIYIVGWAMINPKIAPPLPDELTRVPVPEWVLKFQAAYSPNIFVGLVQALLSPSKAREIKADDCPISYWMLIKNFIAALGPFLVTAAMLGGIWWYVVIHPQAAVEALPEGLQPLGNPDLVQAPEAPAEAGPPLSFYVWFWLISAAIALVVLRYYARMAARMDRDHRHLRADLPAAAEALQHRSDPVGHARFRELAGRVPLPAGRHVGLLSQGRLAAPRHAQPDIRRHDAIHAGDHPVHGDHVSVARHDVVAAELSLRQLAPTSSMKSITSQERSGNVAPSWPQAPHPST